MKLRQKCRRVIVVILLCSLIIFCSRTILKSLFIERSALTDWNNNQSSTIENTRVGFGENGYAANLTEYQKVLYVQYGYDAVLSDHISVNRSIADTRPNTCQNEKYSRTLPKAAIIIICYNERLSVLVRTVHSLLNKTPAELLYEILIVDDKSPNTDLHAPLDDYMQTHFSHGKTKIKLIRLPERLGLMRARMIGARSSTIPKDGVLIFLDSHFEAMRNWLPPLLDPIVQHDKTVTCPIIDIIRFDTFEYRPMPPYKGFFDWSLAYIIVPTNNPKNHYENYNENIMIGGAMAINADFFWELGGFDEGMQIWGGEQFEISFKIWLCGGRILNVPCSHLAHLFRDPLTRGNFNLYNHYSFLEKNFRRIVDVWFDKEQKEAIFRKRPNMKNVNPGDLQERLKIRERLQCKNFSWLLENVFVDNMKLFPINEPDHLANGILQNIAFRNLCLTSQNLSKVILHACPPQVNLVSDNQNWQYNFRGEIRTFTSYCLENNYGKISLWKCHLQGGNQKWFYDRDKQWVVHSKSGSCLCLDHKLQSVFATRCIDQSLIMKWRFTHENSDAMKKWEKSLNPVL